MAAGVAARRCGRTSCGRMRGRRCAGAVRPNQILPSCSTARDLRCDPTNRTTYTTRPAARDVLLWSGTFVEGAAPGDRVEGNALRVDRVVLRGAWTAGGRRLACTARRTGRRPAAVGGLRGREAVLLFPRWVARRDSWAPGLSLACLPASGCFHSQSAHLLPGLETAPKQMHHSGPWRT